MSNRPFMQKGIRQPLSDLLLFAGYPSAQFNRLLGMGAQAARHQRHEVNPPLLCAVANSMLGMSLHFIENGLVKGTALNAKDKFPVRWFVGARHKHRPFQIKARRTLDAYNRISKPVGPYHRNSALILAVKKGWDHYSSWSAPEIRAGKKLVMGDVITALLKAGADPNIKDGAGNTPLHIAVLKRDLKAIAALRAAGARTDLVNARGQLPRDFLAVPYRYINGYLFSTCGGDTSVYVHSLKSEHSWKRARKQVLAALAAG